MIRSGSEGSGWGGLLAAHLQELVLEAGVAVEQPLVALSVLGLNAGQGLGIGRRLGMGLSPGIGRAGWRWWS